MLICASVLAGDGYRRSDMDASLPRPADPDHRISHDSLLSPGGVAGKVGGFYRAPDSDQYGVARSEAAAIKVCGLLAPTARNLRSCFT